MIKDPARVSPVISSQISNPQAVFSQVRSAAESRLAGSVANPNSPANFIAASRATSPAATISNTLTAEISNYSPPHGRSLGRNLHLEVQNTPTPEVDKIADAIQRYLNIKPRREATSDPLDEASILRHPQQIIQSSQRWNEAQYFQFSANGLSKSQTQAQHRTWGGRLELTIENQGITGISAPPSRSPVTGSDRVRQITAYNPAFAAQEAMRNLSASLPENAGKIVLGHGNYSADPDHSPVTAGKSTMTEIRSKVPTLPQAAEFGQGNYSSKDSNSPVMAGKSTITNVRSKVPASPVAAEFGPGNYSNNPANSPTVAAQTTMQSIRSKISIAPPQVELAPGNYSDNPANSPVTAGKSTMDSLRSKISTLPPTVEIGQGNYSGNPANSPVMAGKTTMGSIRSKVSITAPAIEVGEGNFTADPNHDPAVMAKNTMGELREKLNEKIMETRKAGPLNLVDDSLHGPNKAGITSANVSVDLLVRTLPGSVDEAEKNIPSQAYLRAIQIFDKLNGLAPGVSAFGTSS